MSNSVNPNPVNPQSPSGFFGQLGDAFSSGLSKGADLAKTGCTTVLKKLKQLPAMIDKLGNKAVRSPGKAAKLAGALALGVVALTNGPQAISRPERHPAHINPKTGNLYREGEVYQGPLSPPKIPGTVPVCAGPTGQHKAFIEQNRLPSSEDVFEAALQGPTEKPFFMARACHYDWDAVRYGMQTEDHRLYLVIVHLPEEDIVDGFARSGALEKAILTDIGNDGKPASGNETMESAKAMVVPPGNAWQEHDIRVVAPVKFSSEQDPSLGASYRRIGKSISAFCKNAVEELSEKTQKLFQKSGLQAQVVINKESPQGIKIEMKTTNEAEMTSEERRKLHAVIEAIQSKVMDYVKESHGVQRSLSHIQRAARVAAIGAIPALPIGRAASVLGSTAALVYMAHEQTQMEAEKPHVSKSVSEKEHRQARKAMDRQQRNSGRR